VTGTVTNLHLDSTAQVNGNIAYASPNEAEVAPGATVSGTIVRSEPATQTEAPATALALDWFKGVVGLAVLGLVLLALFPRAAPVPMEEPRAWRRGAGPYADPGGSRVRTRIMGWRLVARAAGACCWRWSSWPPCS
jgi:hypothetical protein